MFNAVQVLNDDFYLVLSDAKSHTLKHLLHRHLESAMISPCQCIIEFYPTLSLVTYPLAHLFNYQKNFVPRHSHVFVLFCFALLMSHFPLLLLTLHQRNPYSCINNFYLLFPSLCGVSSLSSYSYQHSLIFFSLLLYQKKEKSGKEFKNVRK